MGNLLLGECRFLSTTTRRQHRLRQHLATEIYRGKRVYGMAHLRLKKVMGKRHVIIVSYPGITVIPQSVGKDVITLRLTRDLLNILTRKHVKHSRNAIPTLYREIDTLCVGECDCHALHLRRHVVLTLGNHADAASLKYGDL